jgi:tetratricopeptide (TPR) repeat protein
MTTLFPLVMILTLAQAGEPAGAIDRPAASLEMLRQRLLHDATDGAFDEFSLFDAALVASGLTDEPRLLEHNVKFRRLLLDLTAECTDSSERARAERVFQFMHARVLTGPYDAKCSNFQATLDEGRFNCVTATLLYQLLCEHVSLNPQIIATPGHVFSSFEQPTIGDVQTTCVDWFRTPHPARDAGSLSVRRRLSDVQLIGKIYYNEGVGLLETNQFSAAIHTLQVSLQLDSQDPAARDNLLAGWNNWALAESDAGRLQRAAELVLEGLQFDPNYAPLLANDLHIHQKQALALCDAGKFEQALEVLERCHARRPDVQLFDMGRLAVVGVWSESLLRDGHFDQAFRVLDQAEKEWSSGSRLDTYEENLVCRMVDSLRRTGRRDQAIQLTTLGLERQPGSERLQRQYRDLTQ